MLKILGLVAKGATTAGEIIEGILSAGYGASPGMMRKAASSARQRNDARAAEWEEYQKARQQYHSVIYKLTRDGLLKRTPDSGEKTLNITALGKKKLQDLVATRGNKPSYAPPKPQRPTATIITFDIPEKERKKRGWLRSALQNLGFTMVQQSVWLGKSSVPEAFMKDLERLRLIAHVEIFEITKGGTLKQL